MLFLSQISVWVKPLPPIEAGVLWADIELAFDKDSNTIRVAASENGMPLKKTKVFGKGFFNQFGIAKRGKFKADFKPDEKALYVSLE